MSGPQDSTWREENGEEAREDDRKGPEKVPRITACLLSATFFTCISSSFLSGYNISVTSAPALFVMRFINQTWMERYGTPATSDTATLLWSSIVSVISLGGLLGGVIVMPMLKDLGGRGTILVSNCFSLPAAVLMAAAERAGSFEMLIVGRFIVGIYSGISVCVRNIYLAEISPKHIRGSITQFSGLMFCVGSFSAQILGLQEVLGHESRWNFLFAFIAIPALLQVAGLAFAPESPRYLLMQKKDAAGAEKALRRFLGKEDVSGEMAELREELQRNAEVVSVFQLVRDRGVRWQLITSIVSLFSMQISGPNAVLFYTDVILTDSGMSRSTATYVTLSTGAIEILAAVASNLLVERAGRRILMIVGFGGMAVCYVFLTVFLSLETSVRWMPFLNLAFILLVFVFSDLGPGCLAFVVVSELFEQSHRPAALMCCSSFYWLGQFMLGLIFPFMQEALQSYVFLVFLVVCAGTAAYMFFVLPETRNKTFVEISQSFAKRNKVSAVQAEEVPTITSGIPAA